LEGTIKTREKHPTGRSPAATATRAAAHRGPPDRAAAHDPHAPVRVAFYTRISTDEDHQKYSLDAQKDRLEAFCKAQWGDDWRIHKTYRDTESGTHMNRPGIEEMLYDAEAQAFDTLLVFRVDRLSRKVRELALMVDELTKHGVALKSITEPFDTTNAAGKMMLQMLGVFAEFEHATIVERTKVGMEKKARSGKFVGGYVPYGYQLDPEKGLVIHEVEALIVRKLFRMYALGKEGSSAICHELNDTGHRNRNGKKWGRRVALYMLRNPVYVGKVRWHEVLHEGTHEPLIPDDLFEKAQEVLRERNEDLKGRQMRHGKDRLLTGVIKCAKCGSHMFGGGGCRGGKAIHYYVCAKRFNYHDCKQDYVRSDLLDGSIVEDLKDMFRDEQFMARVWEEANRRLNAERPDIEKEIDASLAESAKVQASIDRYFSAFEAGKLEPGLCNEKVRDLRARLEELEAERQDLEARREQLELPALDREALSGLMDHFEKVMAEGTLAQKRDLLHRLVKEVRVQDRRTIEVWYALPNPQRFECWNKWLLR
jgi:site-specific DNA recombinase